MNLEHFSCHRHSQSDVLVSSPPNGIVLPERRGISTFPSVIHRELTATAGYREITFTCSFSFLSYEKTVFDIHF
jgi:hypothetical protein